MHLLGLELKVNNTSTHTHKVLAQDQDYGIHAFFAPT